MAKVEKEKEWVYVWEIEGTIMLFNRETLNVHSWSPLSDSQYQWDEYDKDNEVINSKDVDNNSWIKSERIELRSWYKVEEVLIDLLRELNYLYSKED